MRIRTSLGAFRNIREILNSEKSEADKIRAISALADWSKDDWPHASTVPLEAAA